MAELVGTWLVTRCECFETLNAMLHQLKLEYFDVKPPNVFGQEVVGQSGGRRMAKRTLKTQGRHCMDRSRDEEPGKFSKALPPAPGKHSVPGTGSGPEFNGRMSPSPAPTPELES